MKQLQHIFIIIIAALAWSTEAGAWGETTSYVLQKADEKSLFQGAKGETLQLSGPGATITFEGCRSPVSANYFYIETSVDGNNWKEREKEIDLASNSISWFKEVYNWTTYTYDIPDTNVRYIRFARYTPATLTAHYRNVKVTRATTLSTSTTSLSFGNVTKGSSKTLNASVDYNNTTYNQQVTGSSTNGRFSVTATTVGATGTGQNIPVIFKPTAVGAQSGTVTLTMNGKTVKFTVSGTGVTTYYTQAKATASTGGTAYASWTSGSFSAAATSVKNSGVVSTTSASATAYYKAEAASGYVFKGWTWPNDSYTAGYVSTNVTDQYTFDYNSENSGSPTIAAFKAWFAPVFNFSATATPSNATFGTATASVAASVEGNPELASASTTATFTATPATGCTFNGWYESADFSGTPVSTNATYEVTLNNNTPGSTTSKTLYAKFKKNPALKWTVGDLELNIINGTTANSGAQGADEDMTINYTSSNTDALTIDADGTVHAVGLGTSLVTASVAEDNNYNADAISRTFTIAEKKQATFTPAWWEGENQPSSTDIKVGTNTTIELNNVATDATFTISANPEGIVNWTREGNTLTISGSAAGTTELTLSQTGSAILNGNTATYTITVSHYPNTFAVDAENKAMKVGEEWTDVVTNTGNNNTQVSYSADGVATYDAENNKIIAQGEGSTIITFTQAATADYEAKTINVNVTVTKVANTLSVSLPTQAAEVDGTIALAITGQNNADAIVATITDTQLSSTVNNGSDVITYANGVITARNAGTAHIKFSQPATAKYTAYASQTYEITVTKRSNAITLTLNGAAATNIKLKYGATATLAYTRTNMDTTPTVTRTSGSYTTLAGSTITAGNAAGTDIYEISQAETYKYEAGYAQFSIRVNNTDEGTAYVLYEEKEYSHGTGAGVTHTYQLSGPGETLSYTAGTWFAAIYYNLYVEWSADNSSWTVAQDNQSLSGTENKDFSCAIPENARYVRFRFPGGGTSVKNVSNVKATRKTYVRATSNTTAFGNTYTDQTKTATFTVNYSSANGGNINVSSSNPHFVPSISAISVPTNKTAVDNSNGNNTSYICGVDGTQTFTVTYTPDPDQLGAEEAVITIGDLFHSQKITLTATSQKYSTSIARGTNTATETTVDGSIANAFAFSGTSTATPSASSDDDFYYTISHTQTSGVNNGTGVISYDPSTNTITGLNAGTARLTIYQKKTNLYNATSQTFEFTVSKLENNAIMSLSTRTLNVDGTATVELMNADSDGALSATYSNISYLNESQNREGGLLSLTGNTITGVNAGTGTVTITQAETYKYVAKSAKFSVTVNKLTQTLTWDDSDLETTMQVGSTLEGNTATSDAGLTPVTYSSGNTAAITVDANTGVLTAIATGSNVGITASQAGNYKYAPASLTRLFSVFNKQTPAFVADAHFTGANGRIEYTFSATITVTDVSDGDDFSITNGDNTVINVVREGETITITGLKIGNTTLTLAQQGNDDFIAKSQTYNIEVYWPDDFLTLTPTETPSITEGTYRKVFFNREFSAAGYYSLALPFSTTVATLTGRAANADDWVAQLETVTYSQADGYTLHFNKVMSGDITANQPYILHLGAEVVNPAWTNVTLSAATATEITASAGYGNNVGAIGIYSDWSMTSNFEVGMSMNGKYGVVNSAGGLKKGGSSATLNAFSAYITPPTGSAGIKVRSAFTDEFGETTYINGLPDEDATASDSQLYDLSGRRVNAHQPKSGIYVISGRRIVVK